MILGPKDRFSKVPVIDRPVNLRGLLSGPKLCFSKHTSTFPVLTGPEKMVGRYQTLVRALHGRPLEKENELELYFIRIIHFVQADCFFFCISIRRTTQHVLSLTLRSSLFQRRATSHHE